jgi:hypothetical protein
MIRQIVMVQLALLAIFPSGVLPAQRPVRQFKDFPATGSYKGKNAPLVLQRRDREFRTRLREAAAEKPNFANHYILTAWGCGAECLMGAAIDANSGHVYWLPHTICCWGAEVDDSFRPIEYRLDSKLIIFSGERDEKDGDSGTHVYKFDHGKFIQLESIGTDKH